MKKATLQKYDSFQADLDPTWQWGGKGEGRFWATPEVGDGPSPKFANLHWNPSVLKTFWDSWSEKVPKKTLWEGQWRTRPLRDGLKRFCCWDAFQSSPIGEKPACAFPLYCQRRPSASQITDTQRCIYELITCKDLNWWETYRREQQGQHEPS